MKEQEIIKLLYKSAYETKSLAKQSEYIKARAFELLSGMFGSNTESPKDDAYRTSPRIISSALNKYRKFKEGIK